MVEIRTREELRRWLPDKPRDWAQMIAVRAALRAIPIINRANDSWLARNAIWPLRAIAMSWSAGSCPDKYVSEAARASASATGYTYTAAYYAAKATAAPTATAAAGYAADAAAADTADVDSALKAIFWDAVNADCQWLQSNEKLANASQRLSSHILWHGPPPDKIGLYWQQLQEKLLAIDSGFDVWIQWYSRRIAGEVSGFDIPDDKDRYEDQQILMRLATANDEDFWQKGHYFVNSTLQGWINESRARVAQKIEDILPEAPAQDVGAIAYGVNQEGKVDRLPTGNQQHLRDQPDQRQIYADVREAFDELRAEGQRLGETLASALDRIMRSMPEAFEDAQAYLVWRDGNRLRRMLFAHEAVILHAGPDPAKLDLAVAAQLHEALKLYNLFAFGDEGLRAKDENAIPPQERISGVREAELAKPVVAAILENPDIATQDVRDDVRASLDDSDVPPDNPYAPHTIDQNTRTWRNLIAAVVAYGRMHPVVAFVGGGLATGIATAAGEAIFTDVMGTTQVYAPLINFIVANAPAIKAYALTAYSNGSVGIIIDAIVRQVRGVD